MKNQESSGDFNDHHEAQKRKWSYSETADPLYNNNGNGCGNYSDKGVDVAAAAATAKKCMTSYSVYENFQISPQFIISECPSNGQEQAIESNHTTTMTSMTTTIATTAEPTATSAAETTVTPTTAATVATTTIPNCNQSSSSIQMLNTMEIGENIEYVNILYEDDLLTSIQAPAATESHYINFEPNWGNADILDLDQRSYYYEVNNANTINLSNLNGQMSHHNEQEATIHIHQQQQQQHHHHHHQSQIGQNEIQQQCIEVVAATEQRMNNNHINDNNNSSTHLNNSSGGNNSNSNHNNNDIHNVIEYEVIQNTTAYPEAENGREKSASNLPTVHDDSEDKNLSWLYNYKLNELPHLSPEVNRSRTETGLQVDKLIQEVTASELDSSDQTSSNETNPIELNPTNLPKKPPFTYTELIEYALEDKGELTVSGIYNWISDRFPFYKSNDDRWKNSVRHNLSINPHFRKGNKAPQGAGHLWIISTRDSEANLLAWEHKKQRLELFFKMEKTFGQMEETNKEVLAQTQTISDETSTAVANLTSILEETTSSPGVRTETQYQTTMHVNNQNCAEDELKKSAGEILNGIKRTVEVQVVNPSTFNFQDQTILDFPDYLNPVPKDQIVHECGLRSSRNNNNDFCSEYFTSGDMEPIELGINMNTNTDNDDDGLFGDEFNLNYFITPGNNIMT